MALFIAFLSDSYQNKRFIGTQSRYLNLLCYTSWHLQFCNLPPSPAFLHHTIFTYKIGNWLPIFQFLLSVQWQTFMSRVSYNFLLLLLSHTVDTLNHFLNRPVFPVVCWYYTCIIATHNSALTSAIILYHNKSGDNL